MQPRRKLTLHSRGKAEHGFSVHIVDPNIYVEELKVSRDLVDEVLMQRGNQMRMAQAPSRFRGRW